MNRLNKEYVIVDVDTGSRQKVLGSHKLSKNLAVSELACNDEIEIVLYSSGLVMKFQKIRDAVGRSVTVNSGHRTISHNKKVGGYAQSKHLFGMGLDLAPPTGITVDEFHKVCLGIMGLDSGVGVYNTHVHIDNGKHFRKDWR